MLKDYKTLGLKAGLEVHQQLDTGKLFIRTNSKLTDKTNFEIERKLRPVASELGEFDKTALDAFKRNETFIYKGNTKEISLVELDDEPPQPLNKEALKTVIKIGLMTKSNIVDETTVMRKTIIDGSNTSAFQRTALISLGGKLQISNKKIGIETIILEEDACRPIERKQGKVIYNLDRLGIPLIELATAPDIKTPKEAVETAKKIGEIMRLTCKTKRGKGTIRQDVNISIKGGARVEIKGCQELEQIGNIIDKEIERQLDLIKLIKELNNKLKSNNNLFEEEKEVTKAFEKTSCKFIKGKKVFGVKLNGMKGFLGKKIGERRFGSELSDYAKATGVTGLLHLDEMPNYGITEKEVEKVKEILNCTEKDNFVIIVSEKLKSVKAFEAVKERILIAFKEVPGETRGATEESTSVYQRPLAGVARMYPETDIPPEEITIKYLEKIKKQLPRSIEEREKYYEKLGLSENHIRDMKLSNYACLFEEIVKEGGNPKVTATTLLQTLKELQRTEKEIDKIGKEKIKELLLEERKGTISKGNLKKALNKLIEGKTIQDILIEEEEKSKFDTKDIEKEVQKIVEKNLSLVKEKKFASIGPLMGDIKRNEKLKEIDGKTMSEILKKEIQKKL